MAQYDVNGIKFDLTGDNHTPEQIKSAYDYFSKQSEPTLAEKASQFLTKPGNALPLNPLPVLGATKDAANAYVAADKRYPTENLLPAAGGMVGALATAPIPGASIAGSYTGGMGGEYSRQIVSGLRGNYDAVPKDIGQSSVQALKEGGKQALFHVASGVGTAIGDALTAGESGLDLGRKAFTNLTDLYKNQLTPSVGEDYRNAVLKKFGSTPTPPEATAPAKNFLKDILDLRGIKINEPNIPKPTESQLKNFQDAGLSPKDINEIMAHSTGMEGQLKDISSSMKPKLTSKLQTPNIIDSKGMASVYQDLSNPDLTYNDTLQIQKRIGDLANFDAPDIRRTPQQKLYGKVYHELGNTLQHTSETGGFLGEHTTLQQEGQKYHQLRNLNNLLESNRSFDAKTGPETNYRAVASDLGPLTDAQMKNTFQGNLPYGQSIRDLASSNAQTFPQNEPINTRISATGRPTANIRLGGFFKKMGLPENIDAILERNFGKEQADQIRQKIYPYLEAATLKSGFRGGVAAIGSPLIDNANKGKGLRFPVLDEKNR